MRQSSNFISFLLIFGLILNSCDNKKAEKKEVAEFNIHAAKSEIQEKTKQFTKAHITKDTAYLNNIFTEDAKVFPPNSEVVVGKKAISKLNFDWVNYGIDEFKEESTSLYGNKDFVIDEGTFYLRYGSENTIDKGKYINIWKNINGEWKIYSNIWNTNLPIEASNME